MNIAKQNPDLMNRLVAAQNAMIRPVDVVTFGYFCESREELERHVKYYEEVVANQPKRRRKAA
jgi:hypothetical protein